jgi:nuclear transcription factor Y alpha
MMMMPQFMVSWGKQALAPRSELTIGMPVLKQLNSPLFRGAGAQQPSTEVTEEEPVYVNAKQYHRIMIRRQQRAKLEAKIGSTRQRKAYLHDSRHKHAMRRPRGPGGRFLTKSEIAALKAGTLRLEDLPLKAAKETTA